MISFTHITRTGLLFGLGLALAFSSFASATEVTSPVEIIDSGKDFRFEVALAVPKSTVILDTIYNRVAGELVDAGAATVNDLPILRQLQLKQAQDGRFFVDIDPAVPGSTGLRDGAYSQWIEINYSPPPEARSAVPFRQRYAFYFLVANGKARRLTMAEYSMLVESPSERLNKSGQIELVHYGQMEPASTSRSSKPAILIERGDAYTTPNDSERGF
jgi:hypothetical protein